MHGTIILFSLILGTNVKVYGGVKHAVKNIQKSLAMQVLSSQTKNAVVSVLPIQLALCKLASVAKGRVKDELLQTMGFTNDNMFETFYKNVQEMLDSSRRVDLTEITNIYVDYNDAIDTNFIANSSFLYGVNVRRVGLAYPRAAASFINKEIAQATFRRVEDIIHPNDIQLNSSILIISAAHYKPTWEIHFDYKNTRSRKFYLSNKKVIQTPMMSKSRTFLYFDTNDFKVISLKLGCLGFKITFVLPTFLNLTRFLEKNREDPNLMTNLRKQMKMTEMTLVLPRLKIKSSIDLTDHLKQIGLKEIFNSNSTDLNVILKEGVNASNMCLSKVKQKLFFELDEFGMSRIGPDMPNYVHSRQESGLMEFVLDRPFYFTISIDLMDSDYLYTDFVEIYNGVVYEP